MNPDQISADFAAFGGGGASQNNVADLTQRMESLRQLEEKVEKQAGPERIKAASRLAEELTHQQEQKEKAKVYAKIADYLNELPDKLSDFQLPKNYGAKATLAQLQTQLSEMERKLGQGGGYVIVRSLCFGAFDLAEKYREMLPNGYNNLENAGKAARAMCDGSETDQVSPLLREFSIKHASWFNMAVEIRLALAMADVLATINRLNSEGSKSVLKKAATTPSSKSTADKLKSL